jgi:tRNA 2-thiouridine synthesizing protein A
MPDLSGDPVAATLDAGEQNCAVLILNVRKAIMPLAPGAVLAVVAYDPSAQVDLRCWCDMTGHGYLGMQDHGNHATYYLRKRGDPHGEDPGLRQLR